MKKEKTYTISVYTENNLVLLNRISGIFLRRHITITSLNFSPSEIENMMRFTIVVSCEKETIRKITAQIEKQVDVAKAYYHLEKDTLLTESALFKIGSKIFPEESIIEGLVTNYSCRIIQRTQKYIVLSIEGRGDEILDLYNILEPFEILQFVRSGRISVSKSEMLVSLFLKS